MSSHSVNEFSQVLKDSSLWKNFDALIHTELLGKDNPDFLFGVATSTYQDSGAVHCPNSHWCHWEKKHLPLENQSRASANFFELYKNNPLEIIKRLQLLEINTYRFSVEWSHIEPECGKFHEENLKVYINFVRSFEIIVFNRS